MSEVPNTAFGAFLTELKEVVGDGASSNEAVMPCSLPFVPPHASLVLQYIMYLRNVRKLKYNSIEQAVKCISMACRDAGSNFFDRTELISSYMESIDEDDEARAELFHPEVALPTLYETLFEKSKISDKKKINLWARILLQLATISWSSDVTWGSQQEYCPHIRDLEFPTDGEHYREDGMPMYITLTWTDWKGRPTKHRRRPYQIRLWHNPLHAQYCPVTWLLKAIAINKPSGENPSQELIDEFINGPVLFKMTTRLYQKYLRALFKASGLVGHTSHSVRRSAAHWAAQCGLDVLEIKDIGRWISLHNLQKYVSEGKRYHEQRVLLSAKDPILSFWVLDRNTHCSTMEGFNQ
jgi:hypothetical protein